MGNEEERRRKSVKLGAGERLGTGGTVRVMGNHQKQANGGTVAEKKGTA